MQTRTYGTSGPLVIVLHGGPGAAGGMAPVARRLASGFRVVEPLQRASGGEPLTVARHVADLHELVQSCSPDVRPALLGSSWGAMLALAYAAEHPASAGPLVLVGCGTFDLEARSQLHATLKERMAGLQDRLDRLAAEFPDPDRRLRAMGDLVQPAYSYELVTIDQEAEEVDARAHEETWQDMLRLQAEGVYPAAFAAIDRPVLMVHGSVDPHPGRMIRAGLERYVPQLEYRELERCGHYPWLERFAADAFFEVVSRWLARHVRFPTMAGRYAAFQPGPRGKNR